jgi:predicted acylesterase/phospholipase RssA
MPRYCDYVIKGGTAQAIVQLAAAIEMAKRFRFRNVGGSSMGAITASLVAAAECRRARDDSTEGFTHLNEILGYLSEEGSLLKLFTPNRRTRQVAKTVFAAFSARRPLILARLAQPILAAPGVAALGALPGFLIVASVQFGGDPTSWLHLGALQVGLATTAFGAYFASWTSFFRTFATAIAKNNFGLATGMDESDRENGSTLSVWLARELQQTAGLPKEIPLTFGMLWDPARFDAAAPDTQPGDAEINLQLVSTDLTLRTPYTFPARLPMYFDPEELREYFPDQIVTWMIARSRPPTSALEAEADAAALPRRPLPHIGDLPVVVAARISASLPILLSPVPLYARDFSIPIAAGKLPPLERHWFSDGAVTSNASLTMFDVPLPRWPTFAIDFAPFPPGLAANIDAAGNVYMPRSNLEGRLPTVTRFSTFPGLVGVLLDAQRNWTDYRQRTLPGYRDRIVTVFLESSDFGLNIDMPRAVVQRLAEKGAAAGELVSRRFEDPSVLSPEVQMGWENHRWLRLRTALDAMRQYLGSFGIGFRTRETPDVPYAALITASHGTPAQKLPLPEGSQFEVASLADRAAELGDDLHRARNIRAGLPESELDVVPSNSPPKMDVRPAHGSGPVSLLQTSVVDSSVIQTSPSPPDRASEEPTDPPREAHALLECRERVDVGEPFAVTIGIAPEPMRDARTTASETLRRPASSVGPYIMKVTLVAPAFTFPSGPEQYDLLVTAENPYPRIQVTLAARSIKDDVDSALITALYHIDAQPIGSASRTVAITSPNIDKLLSKPHAPAASYVTSIGATTKPADLNVFIIHSKSDSPGTLAWYFLSQHVDTLPNHAVTTEIGDAPKDWSQLIAKEIEERPEPDRLHRYIRNIGSVIASHMPAEFFDAFRSVQAKAGPNPSILLLSEDPYIPWELCAVEKDDQQTTLGAAARVGRWKLADSKLPPPVDKRLDSMAVIYGSYAGKMKLRGATQEMRDLKLRYDARVYPALYADIMEALTNKHDVVHFAMHGTSDLDSKPVGLILEKGAPFVAGDIERDIVEGSFVFLNACQVGRGDVMLGDYAGVASALLRGGASGVVAPLWSVNDVAAKDFAWAFYDGLSKGLPPAEVLRRYRVENPSITTWAYLFYGHPELRIVVS